MIELSIVENYNNWKMRCPVHLSIGQEAVPVGISSNLKTNDKIVTAHRSHAHYLAKGGNLDNAVVVKGDKVLNETGLRSKNEFVNHKILDLAGDFMLAGMRIIGSVSCMHGGHLLTNEFLKKILSNKDNFVITESLENISNLKKITPNQKRIAVNA